MTQRAVSYTHLDVYKRQVLGTVEANILVAGKALVHDQGSGSHEILGAPLVLGTDQIGLALATHLGGSGSWLI